MTAWHYTPGQRGVEIIRTGRLFADPLAWFTLRTSVEPTACRYVLRAGRPYLLSVGEMHRMFAGWLRFGIDQVELVPSDQVRTRAGIRREAWRERVATARATGSDVSQWHAAFAPIEIEQLIVERLEGHPSAGTWRRIPDPRAWRSAMLDAEIARGWARKVAS